MNGVKRVADDAVGIDGGFGLVGWGFGGGWNGWI